MCIVDYMFSKTHIREERPSSDRKEIIGRHLSELYLLQ
ncbi:hypothetical protein SS1G_00935 [Sclerotinia sclerotiorum 1980 UF-70]|uniref:Uncharacterized protein n=1 Tax=Sclerotinia sclerotiorum (strain ATCC 18683 / 1980 / Ss-1) TaxID=665079 RepID=A7E6L0_SCLS1|nr:hypothetical protein SS1G_00935 [Sclerotinia sclerotiorum 1980 UF-70]EDN91532.1 hypothetical protein SS1G_00935 [Sclerotinia sclerotiorum 1980 UF-70]